MKQSPEIAEPFQKSPRADMQVKPAIPGYFSEFGRDGLDTVSSDHQLTEELESPKDKFCTCDTAEITCNALRVWSCVFRLRVHSLLGRKSGARATNYAATHFQYSRGSSEV
jgi:hypothetical protein